MCGRVTRNYSGGVLVDEFEIEEFSYTRLIPRIEQLPLFNVCPSQDVPVVVCESGNRILRLMRWGFVPAWSKDGTPGKLSTINARDDNIRESKLYGPAFKLRRCLVPVSGFYEWQGAKRPKTPHLIYLSGSPIFALAGVWSLWKFKTTQEEIYSFAVVTTSPNELMRPIHDRMPVIVANEDYSRWLDADNQDTDNLSALLNPFPAGRMAEHVVSGAVNSPKNDSEACIAPV